MLMNTSERDQVTPERLMQVGFAYAPPLIIAAAVGNKIFDSLTSAAKTAEQISKETGASVRGLSSIMNALVGLELLKKESGKYSLTPESEAFLVSNTPGTLAGFFSLNVTQLVSKWLRLSDVVRTEQGYTFSFNEIKSWLKEAGFKNARTLEAPGPSPLILATKP